MIRRASLFAAVLASLFVVAVPAFSQTCAYDPSLYVTVNSSCGYYYSPCTPSTNPVNFTLYNNSYPYGNYTPRSCETMKIDFGDGTSTTATSSTFQHTYAHPGQYNVSLTQTANDNSWTHTYSTNTYLTNGYVTFPSSYYYTYPSFREDVGSMHIEVDAPSLSTTTKVQFETVNGTAIAGTRYTATSGTLTFAPGETKKFIDIGLIDDTVFEGSQTFQLRLFNLTGDATFQSFASELRQSITIYDNEPPPTISWSQTSYKFTEGVDAVGKLTVNRGGDMKTTVSMNYYVSGYTSGTLTFNPNETSKDISFVITNDNVNTGNRSTYAELYGLTNGAVFSPNQNSYYNDVQVQIVDDDPIPTVSINDISTLEGNSGSKVVNFTVSMSAPVYGYAYVYYTVETGVSARLGSDYTATSGYLYFSGGQTSATIPVTIYGDTDVESNETFSILLTSTSGYYSGIPVIGKARGICTILNDDFGMGPSNLSVAKGAKGSMFVYFGGQPQSGSDAITLTSSNPSIATVPPSVTVPAASNTISFDVTGLTTGSSQITAKMPASLGGQSLTATVFVYEPATLSFQPGSLTIPNGTSQSITVKLDPPPSQPFDLRVQTTNTSVVTIPSTVNMPTSGTATFSVKGIAKGSALVGVTMPAINGGSDQFFSVQVIDPPTGLAITQVSPPIGPSAGGTSVTITGQNLANTCTFTFGGTTSSNTTFTSASSMTTTTPAHSAGTVDVGVTCGTDQYTLANGFTYTAAAPQLTSVAPGFGSTNGGTVVTINGSNLRSSCGVFFDNMTSKILSTALPDKITVESPAHAAGTSDVSLRCIDTTATLKSAFAYTSADEPSPSISDVDPLVGSVGQRITIKGSRFRTSDVVTFGDTRATIVSTASDSHVVEVPSVPVGKIAINLADSYGHLTTTGPIFSVLEPTTPQITNVTPSKIAPGGEIIIEGRGFRAPYTFALDGRKAGSIVDMNFTRAVVRIAGDMPPATYILGVLNGDGNLAATGPHVDVVSNALVAINVTPQCARADGGAEITITGNGFTPDARVTVGGATATNVRVISANTIKANVPEGALGWGDVVVINPNGDSSTLARAFFYYSPYDNSGGCAISRTRSSRH